MPKFLTGQFIQSLTLILKQIKFVISVSIYDSTGPM